jgi:AraC-like DNA-binding protein
MKRVLPTSTSSCDTVAMRHGSMEAAWHLAGDRPLHLIAQTETVSAGPMLMASMKSGPLKGHFSADSQGAAPFYGVLVQHQGLQSLRSTDKTSRVEAGNIVVWSSRTSCEFELLAPTHETQLLVPAAHFECHWPHLVPTAGEWHWLPGRSALSALSRCGIESLWQHQDDFEPSDMQVGIEALLDMLHQSVRQPRLAQRSRADLYQQVLHYIEQELDNPALAPIMIANRHGCSLRALHALFAEFSETVSGSIRVARLEKCRSALLTPHAERIGQIALRWGFSDAAHFSKLFKATYGASPRQFRDRTMGERQDGATVLA